jgi:hypothetical protein
MRWLRTRPPEPSPPPVERSQPTRPRRAAEQLWGGGAGRTDAPPRAATAPPRLGSPADRRALGYVWLEHSADEAFRAHAHTVEDLCASRGLRLSDLVCEVGGRERPSDPPAGLAWVLRLLAGGEAAALVVPTLDHLSGAFREETDALAWFRRRGLSLVAGDVCSGRFADAATPAPARASGVRTVAHAGIGTLGVDPRSWALAATGASPVGPVPARKPA